MSTLRNLLIINAGIYIPPELFSCLRYHNTEAVNLIICQALILNPNLVDPYFSALQPAEINVIFYTRAWLSAENLTQAVFNKNTWSFQHHSSTTIMTTTTPDVLDWTEFRILMHECSRPGLNLPTVWKSLCILFDDNKDIDRFLRSYSYDHSKEEQNLIDEIIACNQQYPVAPGERIYEAAWIIVHGLFTERL